MNQYQKLYTPADSAVMFIDQQPQMTFGMAGWCLELLWILALGVWGF